MGADNHRLWETPPEKDTTETGVGTAKADLETIEAVSGTDIT